MGGGLEDTSGVLVGPLADARGEGTIVVPDHVHPDGGTMQGSCAP